ncbi:MAG: hypothetical protein H0W88_08665 [Parachlamydiaceae bacterium]|nr:hypothetical protein [Parachlamydiaceae bacterium]
MKTKSQFYALIIAAGTFFTMNLFLYGQYPVHPHGHPQPRLISGYHTTNEGSTDNINFYIDTNNVKIPGMGTTHAFESGGASGNGAGGIGAAAAGVGPNGFGGGEPE